MARYQYAPRGSFRAWLAGIVAEDAQDNGGYGLLEPCADCGGAGAIPATGAEHYTGQDDAGYVRCPSCAGRGWGIIGEGNAVDCSACNGTGRAPNGGVAA